MDVIEEKNWIRVRALKPPLLIVSFSTAERMCAEWLTKQRVCADSGEEVSHLVQVVFHLRMIRMIPIILQRMWSARSQWDAHQRDVAPKGRRMHVVLTCDPLALGGWTSTPKCGLGYFSYSSSSSVCLLNCLILHPRLWRSLYVHMPSLYFTNTNGLRLAPPLGNLLLSRHVYSACVVTITLSSITCMVYGGWYEVSKILTNLTVFVVKPSVYFRLCISKACLHVSLLEPSVFIVLHLVN